MAKYLSLKPHASVLLFQLNYILLSPWCHVAKLRRYDEMEEKGTQEHAHTWTHMVLSSQKQISHLEICAPAVVDAALSFMWFKACSHLFSIFFNGSQIQFISTKEKDRNAVEENCHSVSTERHSLTRKHTHSIFFHIRILNNVSHYFFQLPEEKQLYSRSFADWEKVQQFEGTCRAFVI